MRALFPRWSNHVLWAAILFVLFGAAGLLTFLMLWARTPWATGQRRIEDQVLQFDHRHHVGDDGIACSYCHAEARRSRFAGVPPAARCMGCHAQIWNESPLLLAVRRAAIEGTPLRWRRVNELPDFVFFDHASHVARGVGCETCHGRVDLMPQVYQAAPLLMSWCIDCHRAPEPHLRPLDAIEVMGWRPSRPPAELGREIRAQMGIDPPTFCTGCHR